MTQPASRTGAFLKVTLAYLVALAAAVGVVVAIGGDPLWTTFYADVAGTVVVFAFSLALNNSSVYDPYWSVAPIVIAAYWAFLGFDSGTLDPVRGVLVVSLVSAWGVRLTYNWGRGWPGLHHEDWRYDDFRKKTGPWYWLVSFSGIHLFPTVQVYLGCLALWPALVSGTQPFGVLDVVAALVTLAAVLIETVADRQLRDFVTRPDKAPGQILDTGLWSWSRHPNYFGEMLFWWGLFLFALAAGGTAAWWSGAGAVAITLMFFTVSIPMMEKRQRAKRPHFDAYAKRVSMLIPWPPRS